MDTGRRPGGEPPRSEGGHTVEPLRRTLSFYDLVIYGIAYVCPFGIFQSLGFVWQASDGLIVLAYVLATICMYFTAKSYAVMTEAVPSAGSIYGYARHALGPFAGFMGGWMILLDYLLIPAYVYVFMAVALGTLVPQVDRALWIVVLGAATLGINWFGVRVTSRVNLISVAVQIVVLALLLVLGVVALYHGKGNGALTLRPLYAPDLYHAKSIFTATSICVMSYLGFDAISTLSEEVKSDDKRLVGRAIVSVLLIAAAILAVTAWVMGDLLGGFAIKDPAAATYELLAWAIAPWAAALTAWVMATLVGVTNALPMQVGVARVMYAMGRDRQLPAALAKIHPKHGTPYVGMIATAVISVTVSLLMRYQMDELVSIVNFGALCGFLLLHISVIVQFWVKGRSGRWIVHLAIPLGGSIVVLAVLSSMSPLALMLGLTWLAGGLVYGAILVSRRRAELAI